MDNLRLHGNVAALDSMHLLSFTVLLVVVLFFVFFGKTTFLSHFDHVLAEVVVCAVGWVATLPAMEMTAQATALLVLVPALKARGKALEAMVLYGFSR